MNTDDIKTMETQLGIARNNILVHRDYAARAEARVAKLEADLAEARKPKPLVVQTSWTICGPANVQIEPKFDGSGDLCIAVTDHTRPGDKPYTTRTFVDRDGARAIIDHLTRALAAG
jgi:hypothetical protein